MYLGMDIYWSRLQPFFEQPVKIKTFFRQPKKLRNLCEHANTLALAHAHVLALLHKECDLVKVLDLELPVIFWLCKLGH